MIEGLGTTMDVVLVNGTMREGAQIVVCGLGGPIVTGIRSLLTPHPMKARCRPCRPCIPASLSACGSARALVASVQMLPAMHSQQRPAHVRHTACFGGSDVLGRPALAPEA